MTFIFIPPALYFVPLSGTCLNSLHSINLFLAGTTSLLLPPPWFECASYDFPYHHLAGPCQSQFGHCTLGGRPAIPCKIRPRDAERLFFGPNISKPHGRRRRRHGDCGPGFSPVFHLLCPCDLPELVTRELRRSVLLLVLWNRREHDRALLSGLDCQPRSRISGIRVFWQVPHPILQGYVLWIRWPGHFGISSDHYVSRAFCRMRLTGSLAENTHRATKQSKRRF